MPLEILVKKHVLFRFRPILGALAALGIFSLRSSAVERGIDVDFLRDIQPVLKEHCWSCHGAEKQKGGLRLDNRALAWRGGDSGAVLTPGDAARSPLLDLVSGTDPEKVMPPKGRRLSDSEIALLRRWIQDGAPWPDDQEGVGKTETTHWAFLPPKQVTPPALASEAHPVDRFIRARLVREHLTSAPEADRFTLLRRLTLDLTGLLPSPVETSSFVNDTAADAYERVVDRLLASPHFGERWARHWLDLARYADSDGYQIDTPRHWAHLFRTWVIDSINQDQPFDRFTIDQLAGDLIPQATDAQRVAAGFHRNTLVNREEGVDVREFQVKARVDRVATTATTWMGLTLACAECHSHKYDPLSQREFYEMYAFFNDAVEADVEVHWPGQPPGVKPVAMTFQALTYPPPTHLHVRGDFLRPGAEVAPSTPAALPPLRPRGPRADRLDLARWLVAPGHPLTSRVAVNHLWKQLFGRGLVASEEDFGTQGERPTHPELLDWLAVEFERREWSRKQIIKLIVTSATYRQSSVVVSAPASQIDPANRLLSRQNRLPVEAEIVRDIYLQAGGLLDESIGGPSIRPAFPPDLRKIGYEYIASVTWPETTGPERHRRGLYIQSQRTVPYPLSMTFDAPDPNLVCTRRARANNPLQALARLNNDLFQEAARELGARLHVEADTPPAKINLAFAICLNREPSRAERLRLESFYRHQVGLSSNPASGGSTIHPDAALAQLVMNLDEFIIRE